MRYSLPKNKKNILIFGSGGFIGRHLASSLEKEYNVYKVDSVIYGPKGEDKLVIDLKNLNKVKKSFKDFGNKHKVYCFIHLASRLVSPDKMEDFSVFFDNLRITQSVGEIAKLLSPHKIINFSSIAVYANKSGVYREDSEIKPSVNNDCLYGLSKFCSENILDFMLRNTGTIITHLRVAQVCGVGMRKDRIMPIMEKELAEKNTITVYGNGKRVSNFISVKDLSAKVVLFVKKDIPGVFNVGGENLSYFNLAKKIIAIKGSSDSRIKLIKSGSKEKFILDTDRFDKLRCNLELRGNLE